MTVTASPFLVFLALSWAAAARGEQQTGKWSRRGWGVCEGLALLAAVFAVFGHAKWSHS